MSSHQRVVGKQWLLAPVRTFIEINEALKKNDTGFNFYVKSRQGVELYPEKLEQWDQDEEVLGVFYGADDSSMETLEDNFPSELGDLIRANQTLTLDIAMIHWDEPPQAGMCGGQEWSIHPDGRVTEIQPIAATETYCGWSAADMYHGRDSNGQTPIPWSDEQAREALKRMQYKADVSIGITWDTLDYYLTSVLESANSTTDPGPQTSIDYGLVLPQSREIHRHDFRFLVGDSVFYDVTMTEGSDPSEQTFRLVPTATGGWQVVFDLDGRELRCYWTVTDPTRLAWIKANFTQE